MYIPIDVLEKLKSRLHIVNSESDRNLEEMIEASIVKLQNTCGDFNIQENAQARELVFERVRYAYNDVLEHFEKNFSREITDLQMQLFLKEVNKMKKMNQTYNDGILEFREKRVKYDKYHTVIGTFSYMVFKSWYRKLGITSEEQYRSMQVDTMVVMRVAIPRMKYLEPSMKVEIDGKEYGISRIYENYSKNEIELSLYEVHI
ncbi:phage head closure protein [Staphylococcus epidermidis]